MTSTRIITLSLLIILGLARAFSPIAVVPSKNLQTQSTTSLNVFGTKKSKAQKAQDAAKADLYWEGDWVCKDCGYIYNSVSE